MSPFDLCRPRSLKDAISLLDPADPDVRPMGGGTALMLMMKAGVLRPHRLVSLGAIEAQHSSIALSASGELHIGALATLASLEHSEAVWNAAPAITIAMRRLSNVRIRNVATVGGNLAHADPHMDLPPLLAALDARVMTAGPSGERVIPVDSLIAGYYETVLQRDELIVKVVVPPQAGKQSAYLKVTTRSADDWPALGVAASLKLEGGIVAACRLFVGAATDRPTRLAAAEAILSGCPPEPATLRRAGDAAADEVDLIGDDQGSAAYKKELVRVYVGRAIAAAVANDGSMRRPR
jgi:carbon-monoxide dehydrogenase medium subunit